MTLMTTVSTAVSQGAITRITRLFNGTLLDALNEILQNCRRGGASGVTLTTMVQGERTLLSVADDGSGIDDPANLITLGQSGWGDEAARREDPAGMGMFSLAGRYVEVRSWSPRHAAGWKMIIGPDDWESSAPIALAECDIARGTDIRFELSPAWHKTLEYSVAAAACYFPLPVTLDGKHLGQVDWLDGAHHVEFAVGCRIGVFSGRTLSNDVPRINFHGVTVPCRLPSVIECSYGPRWSVLIDIVDAPSLQLVLPARKEMVENAGLEELRSAIRTAIFRAIARREGHTLSYEDWTQALKCGVELPEATPRLLQWTPSSGEGVRCGGAQMIDAANALRMPYFSPQYAQCLSRALKAHQDFTTTLVEPVAAFEGYAWYDGLTRVENVGFLISQNGEQYNYSDMDERPDLKSGRADAITMELHVTAADGAETTIRLPTDLFISYDSSLDYDLEDAVIVLAPESPIDVDGLTDMLEAVCFEAHRDSDADSWQTQHDQFLLDARQVAMELLLDADEAVIVRCGAVVARELRWLVPEGKMISIQTSAASTNIELVDLPPSEQDAS